MCFGVGCCFCFAAHVRSQNWQRRASAPDVGQFTVRRRTVVPNDSRVTTVYGAGTEHPGLQRADGVRVVHLSWGGKAYVTDAAIVGTDAHTQQQEQCKRTLQRRVAELQACVAPKTVQTKYGAGELVERRADGTYVVQMSWSRMYLSESAIVGTPAYEAERESRTAALSKRVAAAEAMGSGVRQQASSLVSMLRERTTELHGAEAALEAARGTSASLMSTLQARTTALFDAEQAAAAAAADTTVQTKYGAGELVERRADGTYVVQMSWSRMYLSESAIVGTPAYEAERESRTAALSKRVAAAEAMGSGVRQQASSLVSMLRERTTELHGAEAALEAARGTSASLMSTLRERTTELYHADAAAEAAHSASASLMATLNRRTTALHDAQQQLERAERAASTVQTKYGAGELVERRADGTYVVQMSWSRMYLSESAIVGTPAYEAERESRTAALSKRVAAAEAMGSGVRQQASSLVSMLRERTTELHGAEAALEAARGTSASLMSTLQARTTALFDAEQPSKVQPGSVVLTRFGAGVVMARRAHDGAMMVNMEDGSGRVAVAAADVLTPQQFATVMQQQLRTQHDTITQLRSAVAANTTSRARTEAVSDLEVQHLHKELEQALLDQRLHSMSMAAHSQAIKTMTTLHEQMEEQVYSLTAVAEEQQAQVKELQAALAEAGARLEATESDVCKEMAARLAATASATEAGRAAAAAESSWELERLEFVATIVRQRAELRAHESSVCEDVSNQLMAKAAAAAQQESFAAERRQWQEEKARMAAQIAALQAQTPAKASDAADENASTAFSPKLQAQLKAERSRVAMLESLYRSNAALSL